MNGEIKHWYRRDEDSLTRLTEAKSDALEELEAKSDAREEDVAWAVHLLRKAPSHRLKPGERQRVLLGLGRTRAPSRHVWAIRLATVVAALVLATTIARAGLGHLPRWLTELVHLQPPEAENHVRRTSDVILRPRRGIATPAPETASASEAPRSPEAALSPEPSQVGLAMPAAKPARAGALVPMRRSPRPPDRRDDDSGLVVDAMRALHHDGDPALARALSGAYLERHPDGALAEEALALSIEAAIAHQDADVRALGARYVHQYPNGPFRTLARRASRSPGAGSR